METAQGRFAVFSRRFTVGSFFGLARRCVVRFSGCDSYVSIWPVINGQPPSMRCLSPKESPNKNAHNRAIAVSCIARGARSGPQSRQLRLNC